VVRKKADSLRFYTFPGRTVEVGRGWQRPSRDLFAFALVQYAVINFFGRII